MCYVTLCEHVCMFGGGKMLFSDGKNSGKSARDEGAFGPFESSVDVRVFFDRFKIKVSIMVSIKSNSSINFFDV